MGSDGKDRLLCRANGQVGRNEIGIRHRENRDGNIGAVPRTAIIGSGYGIKNGFNV